MRDHKSEPLRYEDWPELQSLQSRAAVAVADACWRRWGVLSGAVNTAADSTPRCVIDPETLILTTLGAGGGERLQTVCRDWVLENTRLLSVQRLRNLLGTVFPASSVNPAAKHIGGALYRLASDCVSDAKDARWKAIKTLCEGVYRLGGAGGSYTDAALAPRRRATAARVLQPGALVLRLRLALGVSIKADGIALLSTQRTRSTSLAEFSAWLGFTQSASRRALRDLVRAGLVREGRSPYKGFRLNRDEWPASLSAPTELDWDPLPTHGRFLLTVIGTMQEGYDLSRNAAYNRMNRAILSANDPDVSALEYDGEVPWTVAATNSVNRAIALLAQ